MPLLRGNAVARPAALTRCWCRWYCLHFAVTCSVMNVMLKRVCLAVSLGLLLSGCTSRSLTAPEPPGRGQPANVRTSADVVKIEAPPISIAAGRGANAAATLSILPGYHVNANPATFDYLIATELSADKSEGLSFGNPIYP